MSDIVYHVADRIPDWSGTDDDDVLMKDTAVRSCLTDGQVEVTKGGQTGQQGTDKNSILSLVIYYLEGI